MTRCFRDVLPAELPSIFAALLTTASADAGSIQSNDSVGLGRPAALWYSRHLSGYGFNNPLTGSRKKVTVRYRWLRAWLSWHVVGRGRLP